MSETPSPTQIYLEVSHKLDTNHTFSAMECFIDLQKLTQALHNSLRKTSDALTLLNEAENALADEQIKVFSKDLEIFSLQAQLNHQKDAQ